MAEITRTVRRLLDEQEKKNLARELGECTRALDFAERKTAVGKTFHRRLAVIIVGLERVRPDVPALRAAAAKGDRMSAFLVEEYAVQCSERDRLLRKMATDPVLADPRQPLLRDVEWARIVLAEAKAERDAADRRRAARAGAQPKPTTATRTATQRKRAAITGTMQIVRRKSADGKPMVMATASSDATDLDREYFSHTALVQMAKGMRGKLAFLGHKYGVPEDVFGTIKETSLEKRQGNEFLDIGIEVETANPRAAAAYEMIRNGTRLGVSVGVIVNDHGWQDMPDGRRALSDVTPLETSIVGIPSNQTAWTTGAKGKGASLTAALATHR